MRKETGGTIALGIIFSIAIMFLEFFGLATYFASTTVMDPGYYKKVFTEDEVIDNFYEMAGDAFSDSWDEEIGDQMPKVDFDELFSREFITQYIGDFIDGALLNEKHPFDEDYYEDYILDEVIPELEERSGRRISVNEQEAMVEDFLDSLDDSIRESRVDLEDNSSFMDMLDAGAKMKTASLVILGIAVVLAVGMILKYKSKFRAARNICLASFLAIGFEAMGWMGLHESFQEMIDEEIRDGNYDKNQRKVFEALGEVFLKEPAKILGIITLLFFIGMIVFQILHKRWLKNSDDSDVDEAYAYNRAEYTAHTAAPLASTGYNSNPYGTSPYGSNPYGTTPYGQSFQDQSSQTQNPYGTSPYGSNPYGTTPYGQFSQDQSSQTQNPYGTSPYGSTPYGTSPYGSSPYGTDPYAQTSQAQTPTDNRASDVSDDSNL